MQYFEVVLCEKTQDYSIFSNRIAGLARWYPHLFEGICSWVREFASSTSDHKSYAGGNLVTGGTTSAR